MKTEKLEVFPVIGLDVIISNSYLKGTVHTVHSFRKRLEEITPYTNDSVVLTLIPSSNILDPNSSSIKSLT